MTQRDFILELDSIKGESQVEKGLIDILSWQWRVENQGSLGQGTEGAGTGKAQIHDLMLTKYLDKSSPNLVDACCTGKHFKKAKLTCKKASGNDPVEYLTIELKTCMVTGLETGGADGSNGQLTETFTLNFEEFKLSYKPQDKTGKAGAAVDVGFNIAENKAV